MNKPFKKIFTLNLFSVVIKNQSKTCINSNVSISVNNGRKLTSNISKSKLAFPLLNEIFESNCFLRFKVIKNQTGVLFWGDTWYMYIYIYFKKFKNVFYFNVFY